MKKWIILSVFLVFLLNACQEAPVVFVGPQPEGLQHRSFIDMVYQGVFICESDSTLVQVQNDVIYKEKAFAFTLTLSDIEQNEEVALVGDQLIITDWPEPLPATITDDLVHSNIKLRDTLFLIGPDQVLKFYKGHLILNKKITDEKWEVQILSLDNDLHLLLSTAEMPEDLEQLNKLTPVKDISTADQDQILLAPTYLEFEEILKQRLIFEDGDFFRRLSSNFEI